MNSRADDIIAKLGLEKHPEGGYFREIYRSDERVTCPDRTPSARSASTSIYYLLKEGDFSAFHRFSADEIWHFYGGDPVKISWIDQSGALIQKLLGDPISLEDASFQVIVPANLWFGARPEPGPGGYSLCGCTVAPGFEFADFELAKRNTLEADFPEHAEVIRALTRWCFSPWHCSVCALASGAHALRYQEALIPVDLQYLAG